MSYQPPASQPQPPAPPYQPPSPNLPPPPAYYQPTGVPGQQPPGYMPLAATGGGLTLLQQFSGPAAWSVGLGLVSIVVPFLINRVFFFLPLIGIYYGIRAIRRGLVIGGVIGLVLSVLGGVVTLIGLFAG